MPVFLPRFGKMLEAARGRLTKGTVVARMHAIGGPEQEGFSRAQLERYEKGERERPDPVVLWLLATIYHADIVAWLKALAEERQEVFVPREETLPQTGQKRARGHPPQGHRSARGRRTG